MTQYHHSTNTGDEIVTDSQIAPLIKDCGKRYTKTRVATEEEKQDTCGDKERNRVRYIQFSARMLVPPEDKDSSDAYTDMAKETKRAVEHWTAQTEREEKERLIRKQERDRIVDKLLEAFQRDMCPYPPDEPCRNMEMDCVACFREFFESFRKGDPDANH